MREKVAARLLMITLLIATFGIAWKTSPVYAPAGGVVWTVPSAATPTLQAAIAVAGPNDEIHVARGHFEVLAGPLAIWQNNLWIIGENRTGPSGLPGPPPPTIDLWGSTIKITGSGVFIWGLNIIDTGGTALGIYLAPGSGNCIIRNNTITGLSALSTGIEVWTANNRIELNNMSQWGTCIDLTTPNSTGNVVVGNTFGSMWMLLYNIGVQVSNGAGFNEVYYNNLGWPGVSELWDANPGGSPPNAFDDTTGGGPSLKKGNFEVTWANPAPYLVPPGTNGYSDNWPWVVPWVQLAGDVNLDGRVDIIDIVIVAIKFTWVWSQLLWDPRADLDGDGAITIVDVVIAALNFGAVDP
ncbi:MAG: hypothetical protein ACE5J6_00370 [Candidatus Bathyarchaeia archaeon]